MKISFNVEVEVPLVPNFLIIKKNTPYSKSGGPPKIAVKDCTEDQLEAIAHEWRKGLLAKIGVTVR